MVAFQITQLEVHELDPSFTRKGKSSQNVTCFYACTAMIEFAFASNIGEKNLGSFTSPPPTPVRYAPPVTEHVPLYSKSCKNMARASGDASTKLGGINRKDQNFE